jgi:crotonobetainyl-CoA hydratase
MTEILTSERIDAAAAARYGLVNEVVPYADLAETAYKWAAKVTICAPGADHAGKAAELGRPGHPFEVALVTRFGEIEQYAQSADLRERNAAGAEGRKPVWSGR